MEKDNYHIKSVEALTVDKAIILSRLRSLLNFRQELIEQLQEVSYPTNKEVLKKYADLENILIELIGTEAKDLTY